MNSLLAELQTRYTTLSKTQKIIADTILQSPDEAVLLSISELAARCHTSETTVMRLIHKLDYDSYQVFRVNLAKDLTSDPGDTFAEELSEEDDSESIRDKVIAHNMASIYGLKETLDGKTIDYLLELLQTARIVYIYGIGASAAVAIDAMHQFAGIGIHAIYTPDPHLMNTLCVQAEPEDLFIAVSHSGESREVLSAVSVAKKRGAKIISMTSYPGSSLGCLGDIILNSATDSKKYCSESKASRLLQLTTIDILQTALFISSKEEMYEKLNESREAVSQNKT